MSQKNEMLEEYDFSKGKRGPVILHKGKTRITIFIDTDILEWFKDEAEREGRGYQTAINQALRYYIKIAIRCCVFTIHREPVKGHLVSEEG
jgi:uncharacterized protein (DUF4415 family)